VTRGCSCAPVLRDRAASASDRSQNGVEYLVEIPPDIFSQESPHKVAVLLQQLILPAVTAIRLGISQVLASIELHGDAGIRAQLVELPGHFGDAPVLVDHEPDRPGAELVGELPPDTPALGGWGYVTHCGRPFRLSGDVHQIESSPRQSARPYLVVKEGERYLLVPVSTVHWLEATGNYVRLHCEHGGHLIRSTLSAVEARLAPGRFQRVHRSWIVNLEHVREAQPWNKGGWILVTRKGFKVPVGQQYHDVLSKILR
jgi:hypothetical protein